MALLCCKASQTSWATSLGAWLHLLHPIEALARAQELQECVLAGSGVYTPHNSARRRGVERDLGSSCLLCWKPLETVVRIMLLFSDPFLLTDQWGMVASKMERQQICLPFPSCNCLPFLSTYCLQASSQGCFFSCLLLPVFWGNNSQWVFLFLRLSQCSSESMLCAFDHRWPLHSKPVCWAARLLILRLIERYLGMWNSCCWLKWVPEKPGSTLTSHQILDVCKFCSNSQSLLRDSIVLMQGGRLVSDSIDLQGWILSSLIVSCVASENHWTLCLQFSHL